MDDDSRRSDRRQRGQALVEYSLLLGLLALVVIGSVLLVELGVQRVYSVVAGTLGVKHDTNDTQIITIQEASCYVVSPAKSPPAGQTGLWVIGDTNVALADLTGSTNQQVGGPLNPNGAGFKYQPLLASAPDTASCSKSVVIQSKKGAIVFAPVELNAPRLKARGWITTESRFLTLRVTKSSNQRHNAEDKNTC